MKNSPLPHNDYQFTNLLLLTTLVRELNIKEQVTIEILVIVTIVIVVPEMSIHV